MNTGKKRSFILSIVLLLSLLTVEFAPVQPPPAASAAAAASPAARVFLPVQGIISPIERRGFTVGYADGQLIRDFNTLDPYTGSNVADEASLQLDMMHAIGINTFTIALSAADPAPGPFVPPQCTINPDLGLLFPQPTPSELANLASFFDLVHSKGMRMILILSTTHMEEQPPTNNETWLGSILNVVKDHPALDLVLFSGDAHTYDYDGDGTPDACGGRAEPNLWEGPTRVGAVFVKWAIAYAHSLGLPYRKLSAEAIIGDYISRIEYPNQYMTDGHFWDPIVVLKGIFDDLAIPTDQRTYTLSFYEHRKCQFPPDFVVSCEEASPHEWALDTINHELDIIGRGNGARILAAEMGSTAPAQEWSADLALESLVWIMHAYGIDGGCFWRWVNFDNTEDFRSDYSTPVLQISPEFTFNPVKDILEALYAQGQTDDLSLTPDAVPPVFGAVAKNPAVVKNGDSLEITADLGETHLFVTADLSALDSSQTVPRVLVDRGDGTYKTTTSISLWNVNANGVKTIPLKAMDFWSNASLSSLTIELDNPTPVLDSVPPDDGFDESALNLKKWQPNTAGGAVIAQDGRLVFTTSSQEAFSSAGVTSTWQFPGDFDAQVDFEIGAGWQAPAAEHLDGAAFGVTIGDQTIAIVRLRNPFEDKLFGWQAGEYYAGNALTAATAGKLRMIRAGNELMVLFDIGGGWKKLLQVTVPPEPARIYLDNGSIFASLAFTTYFDAFHINSGRTTYVPDVYLPVIRR